MNDEKTILQDEKPADDIAEKEQAIWDMKQELEDYLEEQGIYIPMSPSRSRTRPSMRPGRP